MWIRRGFWFLNFWLQRLFRGQSDSNVGAKESSSTAGLPIMGSPAADAQNGSRSSGRQSAARRRLPASARDQRCCETRAERDGSSALFAPLASWRRQAKKRPAQRAGRRANQGHQGISTFQSHGRATSTIKNTVSRSASHKPPASILMMIFQRSTFGGHLHCASQSFPSPVGTKPAHPANE